MTDFRFANPEWLHAIWIVLLVVALLVFLEFRGRSVLDRFVSRIMQSRLVQKISFVRRLLTIALIGLSMIFIVVTLMRPQWGRTVRDMAKVESQIMICLDLSKSMLAEDVAPSRLERAKVELDSLLGLMDEGQQVGLIGYAGKATVLCPMTTDFGFLRLVLKEANPDIIGLGGTKIGDAIRTAVRGFGETGDINRMIMLLTDGEDHDSFPMEVAAEAREKGIRIVSIGFGDEAGSKIEITDPQTGARSFLKDRNGREVLSRLDGATLRDIALETEGAYIPAATGALDLESIYEAHIKSMLAGSSQSEQRIIRNEAFQIPLLAAVLTLVFAFFVSTSFRLKERAANSFSMTSAATLLLIFSIFVGIPQDATAATQQTPPQSTNAPNVDSDLGLSVADIAESDGETFDKATSGEAASNEPALPPIEEDIAARDAYNKSLPLIAANYDRAEEYLNLARRNAGTDGEVRYRALYSLGWLEVNRADNLLESEPEKALNYLEQAANRFREAIRVRPESNEARHNLEIVSRRILELSDSLNKKDPRDLAARLDELIQNLRETQNEIGDLSQSTLSLISAGQDESLRKPFRALGATQRQVISDLQKFSDDARKELDGIETKPEQEQSDEEKLKLVQLSNMLHYLEKSLQRLNRSRSMTRRLEPVRSFQRWTGGLVDAKRARDQLRNPVEIIGQLIGETSTLKQQTDLMSRSRASLLSDETAQAMLPAWLDRDFLVDNQTSLEERARELNLGLKQLVENRKSERSEASSNATPEDAEAAKLFDNIELALPFLAKAENEFSIATGNLSSDKINEAKDNQSSALTNLNEAWELFFDIRRMIEVLYQDESRIESQLDAIVANDEIKETSPTNFLASQTKNLARATRLKALLDDELEKVKSKASQPAATAGTSVPGQPEENAELQRVQVALQLLKQTNDDFEATKSSLEELAKTPIDDDPQERPSENDEDDLAEDENKTSIPSGWKDAQTSTNSAVKNLEELRRLYFSLLEHLKDTANRQADLNDETISHADTIDTVENSRLEQEFGPLGTQQDILKQMSDQIANALKTQAEQAAQAAEGQPNRQQAPTNSGQQQIDPQQAAAQMEKLAQASGLVADASSLMQNVNDAMDELVALPIPEDATDDESPRKGKLKDITESQNSALQKLAEAIQLLDEKNDDQQDQDQQQQQNQEQDQQQQESEQQQQQQNQMNAEQLLQMIRDREAERRKDKQKRAAGSGGVDKDW